MKHPIDRINYIMEQESVSSYNSLAKNVGLNSAQIFYDFKSGKVKNISGELGAKIIKKYIQYDLLWLIEGIGNPIAKEFRKRTEVESVQIESHDDGYEGGIPIYNFPAAAGGVEVYNDPNDVKIIGHLNIPGAHKNSFALPAYGHSMYPTLANGDLGIVRPIEDPNEIAWGEVYYIEWADYKMYKRLLLADDEDKVILWSDNQEDKIGTRAKYSPITIKKEKIRKLCLVTEILKKPNY
ncbi:hypothetical protein FAZ19_16095 [Sphingobacterium alkalisoli]|uniref:Peptidase S24/S26A/S26B/S26C domain-containing protein n=1 Tax=Sphingobacterium alkalisoli TaxID=1874115 RepID=A0A4U0GXC7_9SPHI|nr:S24 family peptidase [Sphingobacterium alkalisoli]TJY63787.1 hypothetical protein FAZ19_16095 [Sphingobacterium alkalisoli]GGH24883.1 hypothetical protein GCM10011418_33110 [Sphingobacterium alkalisoli]